jgi:LPXTG-motif cell wall-anchored protein
MTAPGTLPRTGSNTGDMAAAGLTLVALGAIALRMRRFVVARA